MKKHQQLRKQLRKQSGQGMTEYIIIVALIAVSAIAVYAFYGKTVREQTSGMALELSGQKAGDAITAAQSAANSTKTDADKSKGLGAYTNDAVNDAAAKK